VNQQEADATIIDYNVASWCQEEILAKQLRFTLFLKKPFHKDIQIHGHTKDSRASLLKCLDENTDSLQHVNEDYIREVNFVTLDSLDIKHAMSQAGVTPLMTSMACVGLVVLLVVQLLGYRKSKNVKTGTTLVDGE